MTTLTKLALGMMGRLRPAPALGDSAPLIALPPPRTHGGMPLMDALGARHSAREFTANALPLPLLSDLLWAACGINRPGGGRTAPSAMDAQEVHIYAALASGAYRYEPRENQLQLVAGSDVRRVTGYQDFVDEAPLDLIFVADHARMHLVPAAQQSAYAYTAAGAISQNIYLFSAANGLATVIRAWINREAIADALGLQPSQQVLLSQTVGYPRPPKS